MPIAKIGAKIVLVIVGASDRKMVEFKLIEIIAGTVAVAPRAARQTRKIVHRYFGSAYANIESFLVFVSVTGRGGVK